MTEIWTYRIVAWVENDADLTGYEVDDVDGKSIGKIDEATAGAGDSYIIVDAGSWIFGKRRLIPAGTIARIDHESRNVTVNLTKDQIKEAPDYEQATWNDEERARTGEYYRPYSA
jgi:hypothetical protein